jgi:hypothetical protein
MRLHKRLWIGLAALVLLSPIGLLLPAALGAGSAWGEWSTTEMQELAGYLPGGMQKLAGVWKAPMPDYAVPGREAAPLPVLSLWYLASGVLGGGAVMGVTMLLGRVIAKHEGEDAS